jgi:multidrug efflux system membrane fusion protein
VKVLISSLNRLRPVSAVIAVLAVACLLVQGCNRGTTTAESGGKKNGKKGGRGGRGGDFGPVPVVVAKTVKRDVPVEIAAVGNVEAFSTISIKPQVSGQLTEVFIVEGDYVKKGQKLFQIDPRPIEGQVAQAEATLARDRAQLGQVTANLARDLANEKYAREQATRYSTLFEQGIVSKDDRERFTANADALSQLVQADKAAIESAKAQIQADEANLANIKLQLSFTTIYSPLDGRSGNVTVKAGNIVTANQTELMQITQVQPIYVTFSVPENRLSEIQRAAARSKLPVEADSQDGLTPPEFGTLSFVDNTVDATTGTIKLKGTFQNPTHSLWPGEFVNVKLRIGVQSGAIVIPGPALQAGQEGSYVYVVKEDRTVEARPVTPGIRLENEVVVDKGLAEGETVVTEGQLRLAPGSSVILPGENGRGGGRGNEGRGGRGNGVGDNGQGAGDGRGKTGFTGRGEGFQKKSPSGI